MKFPLRSALLATGLLAVCTALPLRGAETPPTPPPAGAISVTRDSAANFWALAPAANGRRELVAMFAQDPSTWRPVVIQDIEPGDWQSLRATPERTIVVTGPQGSREFDFRYPDRGSAPARAAAPVQADSPWRMAARMPASNHDISAAVVNGRIYVAGGHTHNWGYPSRDHFFDELWELDPSTWTWRVAAKLSRTRVYCSTVAFGDRVWIVGGDVFDDGKQRVSTTLVESYDPRTGQMTREPDLPVAVPVPLTGVAGGRLWMVGSRDRQEPARFASIGPGEKAWRTEPDALPAMWALSGAALNDRLYACVPNVGLAEFDPATSRWTLIPGPSKPRSSQVAAWRGELWLVGGCDLAHWGEVSIYNPTSRTWRRGPTLPIQVAWGAAAVVNDQLVVMGGAGVHPTPNAREYDFSDRTFVLPASAIPPALPAPDGNSLPRWNDAKLSGTGAAGYPYTTEELFPGLKFTQLATILRLPGGTPQIPERWLLAEVNDAVWTVPMTGTPKREPFLNLPARSRRPTHTMALALHPKYPAEPYVYVLYNLRQPKPAENIVSRFTVELSDPPRVREDSEMEILRWPSDGHNGGDLQFGPDGYFYISVGDRSAPGDPNDLTQRLDIITSGMLRIDVNRTSPGKNYAVPADNPWVGQPGILPEFWAYGLRNPWRMHFAPNGDLWVGDNGDDSWEMIHLVRKGHNYGWSIFEGAHPFKRLRQLAGPTPVHTPPVIELPHSESHSAIGGLVYQGRKLPDLVGDYVFGDYVNGIMWAFRWDGKAPQNFRKIADTRSAILSFTADRDGEIVMVRTDGQVHRLIAAPPLAGPRAPFPTRLSETGLFSATGSHTPAPGVIPYEVTAGVWSDGALARRLLAVSSAKPAPVTDAAGALNLPDGSAVVRTLELPTSNGPRRVETQLMYREHETWRFYTYAWNEAQTDAELVREEGETRPVAGIPNRAWHYSSRGECTICHSTQSHFTNGLNLAQLNRDGDFTAIGRRVENQISVLAAAGIVALPAGKPAAELPRKVDPFDPSQPLAARARSYLDANCAHCHRFGGVGGRANFQFLESIPMAKAGIIDGKPLVPLLGADSRVVTPGRPDRSELYHRITLQTGGRMPLIGSEQSDKAGVDLIRQWIEQLPH
jgi:glucose/arabinose dehydrogenase